MRAFGVQGCSSGFVLCSLSAVYVYFSFAKNISRGGGRRLEGGFTYSVLCLLHEVSDSLIEAL